MKTYIVALVVFAVGVINPAAPAWSVDKVTDATLVKRQTALVPKLTELVADAGGFPPAKVVISVAPHQISIAVAIKKGKETAADREIQAAQMRSAVENEIAGKDEFGQVMVIHVNYVERHGKSAPLIQGYDFFKSPEGAFVLHKT